MENYEEKNFNKEGIKNFSLEKLFSPTFIYSRTNSKMFFPFFSVYNLKKERLKIEIVIGLVQCDCLSVIIWKEMENTSMKKKTRVELLKRMTENFQWSFCVFFPSFSSRVHLNWLKTKYFQSCSAVKRNFHCNSDDATSTKKHFERKWVWSVVYEKAPTIHPLTFSPLYCWPKQSKYKEKNQQAPQKICLHYFPNAIEAMIWCFFSFLCK